MKKILTPETIRVPRIEMSCPICGSKFIKRETESKRFCSRKCAWKGNGLAAIGRKMVISEKGRSNWKIRSANPEYRRRLSIGLSRAVKNGTMIMPLGFRDEETQRKAQESLKLSRKNGSYPEKVVYKFLLQFFSEDEIKRGFEVQGPIQKVGNQTGIVGERHRQYFLDIALLNKKVDIEIDGEIYHLNKERDSLRDSFLKENGWKVIRVPAKRVSNNEYKEILNDKLNLY